MVNLIKMSKKDLPTLYEMALRAFQPDYEQYGFYPPLLNRKRKRFLPPIFFGKVIKSEDTIIGGMFVVAFGSKGEIGAIFIDPMYQKQGYGWQAMQAIESKYPKVQRWKLETPAESLHLHRFYESLGYEKTGEREDPSSHMVGFVYEKTSV